MVVFRTDLGPRPGSEIRNEDTEFGLRLIAAGERLHYEPSAVVYHAVPQDRVRKKYFLSWWFDKARADIRQYGIPPATRWYIGRIPLYLFRRLVMWTARWLADIRAVTEIFLQAQGLVTVGEIVECYRQSRTRSISQNGVDIKLCDSLYAWRHSTCEVGHLFHGLKQNCKRLTW